MESGGRYFVNFVIKIHRFYNKKIFFQLNSIDCVKNF